MLPRLRRLAERPSRGPAFYYQTAHSQGGSSVHESMLTA